MGGMLVLTTNRKSHVSFRLVPKSVILNDLQRRNGRYFALFHQFGSFRAHCVKVVEDTPYFLRLSQRGRQSEAPPVFIRLSISRLFFLFENIRVYVTMESKIDSFRTSTTLQRRNPKFWTPFSI